MEDYKTIKGLRSLPEFERIIKKITLYPNDETIKLEENEKVFLLSSAIILSKNYSMDKRYQSYAELAYYIILKYSLITNDFTPLYDFAVNFGFYPIAKSLVEKEKIEMDSIINYNTQARIEEEFKFNNLIETYNQKEIRNSILESESIEICFIAPTSFGKSSLIVEDIKKNLKSRNKISVIVPTKSLLTQTFRMLKKEIPRRKIILHDEMYENETEFLSVLTQERALRLLQKNGALYFDTLYIDEAHNLFNKDSRTILLSRLIRLNKKRNTNHRVIYLSPLISNSDNLRFDIEQDIVEQKIDFNMKEPEIYELCSDSTIQKYNRFIDKFYPFGNENSFLSYIYKTKRNKNFFFLTAPRKIEMFAKQLYDYLPSSHTTDIELEKVAENLKKYIHEDFYGIHYLKKGIVYLHGKLPDHIKEYLEYKFQTLNSIHFLVANNVILEGINLPIDSLYILSVHALSAERLTNLIGRVNRLNMIFNSSNEDYSLLLPNVHFVNTHEYGRKNGKMSHKIRQLRTGRFPDEINNPLLLEFDMDKFDVEKDVDLKKLETAKKIISEETFILGEEVTTGIDKLKKKMIELGMNTVYNMSDSLCELLLSRITKKEDMIEDCIISEIQTIFVNGLDSMIIDEEFARLKNHDAISYYENFISYSKKKSLKENIENVLSHFRIRRESNNSLMYMGGSYGEVPYDGINSRGNPVYVELKQKNDTELVNLAIVKLKLENDFINYTMIKFFQLMLDYNIISNQYYNSLVYGTNNETKLNLLKQGLTINVINKLDSDNQIQNIIIDENNIASGNKQFEEYKETLDDFFRFEIDKYFN